MIAKSFARIFYRNAINIGLPVIVCKDLYDHVKDQDEMELYLEDGIIKANGTDVYLHQTACADAADSGSGRSDRITEQGGLNDGNDNG